MSGKEKNVMNKKFINVLNCNDSAVALPPVNGEEFMFEAGTIKDPFIIPMSPEKILYINSKCRAFKDGVLRFEQSDVDAGIYEELGIADVDGLMFKERIDDILLNPTVDGLKSMLSIKDSSQFERFRGRYYYLINTGEDVSAKVGRLVEARYEEFRKGKLVTSLSVTPIQVEKSQSVEIEALKKQLEEMRELLMKQAQQPSTNDENKQPESEDVAKKARRTRKAAQSE